MSGTGFAANHIAHHPQRSPVFFGDEGLRAGWGILLFLVLAATLSQITHSAATRFQHKLAGASQNRTTHQSTAPEAVAAPIPPPKPSSPRAVITAEGSGFLAVLLATFLTARVERRPIGSFGLGGIRRMTRFFQGLLSGLFCLSLLVSFLRLAGLLHVDAVLLHGTSAIHHAVLWAIGFTLVALLEETLLRGYLQVTLARGLSAVVSAITNNASSDRYGFWSAALILSFLFGLGHGSNPGESPLGLLSAGLAGLVFCLALYRTGSLWWAIGFHASWDWAQSFLYGVADSGSMIQSHLYATHPVGKPILSGGLTGPEGSIFVVPTLALAALLLLVTCTHRIEQAPLRAERV